MLRLVRLSRLGQKKPCPSPLAVAGLTAAENSPRFLAVAHSLQRPFNNNFPAWSGLCCGGSTSSGLAGRHQAFFSSSAVGDQDGAEKEDGEVADGAAVETTPEDEKLKWGSNFFDAVAAQQGKFFPRKNKNGRGIRFARNMWKIRYPEPCYWTVTRFKPRMVRTIFPQWMRNRCR